MIARRLSDILDNEKLGIKDPMLMRIISMYNFEIIGTRNAGYNEISLENLGDWFEDWDIFCDAHEINAITDDNTTIRLGLIRPEDYEFPPIKSIKIKGKSKRLELPFLLEDLLDYLSMYNLDINFEPAFVKRGFKNFGEL